MEKCILYVYWSYTKFRRLSRICCCEP